MSADQIQQAFDLARAGNKEEARRILKQVSDRDNPEFWKACALAAESKDEAIACLKRALEHDPDDAWTARNLEQLTTGARPKPPTPAAAPPRKPHPRRLFLVAVLVSAMILVAIVAGWWLFGRNLPLFGGPAEQGPTPTLFVLPTESDTPAVAATETEEVAPQDLSTATTTPTHTPTFTPTVRPVSTEEPTATPSFTPTAEVTSTEATSPTPTDEPEPTLDPEIESQLEEVAEPTIGPCDCYTADLDCTDFDSKADAQACYEYCLEQEGRDVHQLDEDLDGQVCP